MDFEHIQTVYNYIQTHWENTVREQPEDTGTLLGLPFRYTVPCQKDSMQNNFYWDTYFTNVGLLKQGFFELAKSNTDNLLYEVNRHGFVPNGNRTFFLNRSQPPVLALMVRDIFDITDDLGWLESAYSALKKEYAFWMGKRMTPVGLNRYFHHANETEQLAFFNDVVRRRLDFAPAGSRKQLEIGAHYLAEAESGWDFTPRFEQRCSEFIPVDLNSLLYLHELSMIRFCEELENDEKKLWEEHAERRKQLFNTLCWDNHKELYSDYDFAKDRHSAIASLATYAALWAELATKKQARAISRNLKRFEHGFGISACEESNQKISYQWDYPNGWPPLFYMTIAGLLKYGYAEHARRIAEKYVRVVVDNFRKTGDLWEKYNIVDGSTNVQNEYEMPAMLGWTAGVFVYCVDFLRSENELK